VIAAVVRDRPGEGVKDHIEPEFEPVAEVVSAVTPDHRRDATHREPLSTTHGGGLLNEMGPASGVEHRLVGWLRV
jgi:hypothetical protein